MMKCDFDEKGYIMKKKKKQKTIFEKDWQYYCNIDYDYDTSQCTCKMIFVDVEL